MDRNQINIQSFKDRKIPTLLFLNNLHPLLLSVDCMQRRQPQSFDKSKMSTKFLLIKDDLNFVTLYLLNWLCYPKLQLSMAQLSPSLFFSLSTNHLSGHCRENVVANFQQHFPFVFPSKGSWRETPSLPTVWRHSQKMETKPLP